MFDSFYSQIAKLLLQTSSYKEDSFFGEKRMIYFANGTGEGEGGGEDDTDSSEEEGEGKPEGPETTKKPEKPEEAQPPELAPEVVKVSESTADRVEGTLRIIDELGYHLPPGITEEQIKEARTKVSTLVEELNPLNNQMDNLVLDFIEKELGEPRNKESQIFKGMQLVVEDFISEYSYARDLAARSKSKGPLSKYQPKVPSMSWTIRNAAFNLTNKTKHISLAKANAYSKKFMELAQQIAEKEWEMLRTINDVKEVMWTFKEKAEKKHLDERAIKEEERYVGIPLVEGQIFVGDAEIVGYVRDEETGRESLKTTKTQRWKIRKIYVNDQTDPNDAYSKRNGVWIELQKEGSAKWQTMSPKMLRDFASLHDLKPDIERKEQLPEAVRYMREMQLEFGEPPFTIEYQGFNYDETGHPVPAAKTVEITQMDATGVTFSEDIVYRSMFQTAGLGQNDERGHLTYAEFAKWLNVSYAIPQMSQDDLQSKLNEYSNQLNALYQLKDEKTGRFLSRDPECHGPIRLQRGEVLYSEAPGSPLYRIEYVDPAKGGTIHLNVGGNMEQTFTFNEFLRWIYQYELERYDPEFEVNKCVKYGNLDPNDEETKQKIRERAEAAKERLEDPGKSREDIKKINIRDEIITPKADGKPHIPKEIEEGELPPIKFKERPAMQAQVPSYNFLRKFWNETQFLTLDDLGQLFKSGYDYYIRNWERRRKKRYSAIGKGIPWFGTEFERINQQAENEEVGQFKDAMDQWGVWQIEETLYETGNQDQAKACLNVLAEKGMIRWDDPKLWMAINKFADESHQIPWPLDYTTDPTRQYKSGIAKFNGRDVGGKTGLDLLPEAMDSIWGESSYISWKRQNDSIIEDNIQKSYNKAEELENDPKLVGGIRKELAFLLEKHANDEYVDPSEYEGLIRFIIEAGKARPEDKMYFILMGATLKNTNGRTLMGWERIGRFISKYCNAFPAIDYFTDKNPRRHPSEKDKFVDGAWTKGDFEAFTAEWCSTAEQDGYLPNTKVKKFLYDEVLTSEALQIRLEKGIRNAEKMDHDDTPLFIPALKESAIDDICSSSSGSSKKFTIQGYKNAYLGFGFRMNALVSKFDEELSIGDLKGGKGLSSQYRDKLISAFQSFTRYDAILDNRYEKGRGPAFQRFDQSDYATGCVWDTMPLVKYQKELQDLTKRIIEKYRAENDPRFKGIFEKNPPPPPTEDPVERKKLQQEYEGKEKEINNRLKEFGNNFRQLVMSDGGAQMIDIVRDHAFIIEGLADITPEQALQNKLLLELPGAGSPSSTAE